MYPARLIEWYASTQTGTYPDEKFLRWGRNPPAGNDRRGAEVTRFLAERDARLLFGSDTPSAQLHTNPPGLNGRLEMDNWIAAGVSEAKLFRAMTIDNARIMRLDDEIGTVEPGKKANLLLVSADPLESPKPMMRSRRYSCTVAPSRGKRSRRAMRPRPGTNADQPWLASLARALCGRFRRSSVVESGQGAHVAQKQLGQVESSAR